MVTDKRKRCYRLTEKGLDFMPILREVANGSAERDPQTGIPPMWIAMMNEYKAKLLGPTSDPNLGQWTFSEGCPAYPSDHV